METVLIIAGVLLGLKFFRDSQPGGSSVDGGKAAVIVGMQGAVQGPSNALYRDTAANVPSGAVADLPVATLPVKSVVPLLNRAGITAPAVGRPSPLIRSFTPATQQIRLYGTSN